MFPPGPLGLMYLHSTTRHGALFDGDCLTLVRSLRPEVVDCVFADPPFNIGKDYKNGFSDALAGEQYMDWCREWIEECTRVLKPGGSFFLYALPELAIKFGSILGEHLTFRHWIALTMKGTFRRGKRLYPAHYALLYYTRGEPRVFNTVRVPVALCRHCGKEIKDYGGHRGKLNPAGLNLTDFWDDTSPNRHKKFKVRPGVNELKMMIPERAILMSTEPGDLIFDPFGGGGSTYQAAEKHHRNWLGVELYDCSHIRTRLDENFPLSLRQPLGYPVHDLFLNHEDYQATLLRWGQRENLQAGGR